MTIDEKARVYTDRDWWRSAGDLLGLELRGWTFRNEASFADKETACGVEIPGWLAERILAYESAKQKEADGWRDIASAPKDGTHFLGFWPGGGEWRAPIIGIRMTWFWCAGSAASAIGRDGEFTAHFHRDDPIAGVSPSHWRPLPEPPSALLSAGGENG